MVFAVEAWTIPLPDDEESCEEEMVSSCEYLATPGGLESAMFWAWQKMEEGFFVRMFRRENHGKSYVKNTPASEERRLDLPGSGEMGSAGV